MNSVTEISDVFRCWSIHVFVDHEPWTLLSVKHEASADFHGEEELSCLTCRDRRLDMQLTSAPTGPGQVGKMGCHSESCYNNLHCTQWSYSLAIAIVIKWWMIANDTADRTTSEYVGRYVQPWSSWHWKCTEIVDGITSLMLMMKQAFVDLMKVMRGDRPQEVRLCRI